MSEFDLETYQVGIICALFKELKAVRAILDEEYKFNIQQDARDDNTYVLGRIHQHKVVLACLPSGVYGSVSAANVSKDMLRTFPAIRFGLLVGIGGGIPNLEQGHDIRLGDVVVSLPEASLPGVIQFDFGKTVKGGKFERVGSLNKPPALLLTALSRLRSQLGNIGEQITTSVSEAHQRYPDIAREGYMFPGLDGDTLMCATCDTTKWWWPLWLLLLFFCPLLACHRCERGRTKRQYRSHTNPEVHYGTILTGNRVIKYAGLRDQLGQEFNALCVEMEASGLMDHYPCLVIRGICDYADQHKNKNWQEYASLTAAAFAKLFLEHISVDESNDASSVKHLVENLQVQIEEVQDQIADNSQWYQLHETRYQKQKHLDCHRAFNTTQYQNAKDAIPARVPGTCRWVLDSAQFAQWRQISTDDLLWISADPGCGKSVLARSLVDNELRITVSHHVCYFFFKDIEERNTLVPALCALLHQIFEAYPELLEFAMPVWEKHEADLLTSIDLLWSTLMDVSHATTNDITFVLDALDECREDHRNKLIKYLLGFYEKSGSSSPMADATVPRNRVKFLVTSRPYHDIERDFSLPDHIRSIRLRGEDESDQIKREIDLVISIRMKELGEVLQLKPVTKERLEQRLLTMDHRTYLWLYLAIEGIEEDLRDSLCPEEEIIQTLPTSVENAYEAILKRVKARKNGDVKLILSIVVGAKRSLTIEEMAEALGVAVSFESDRPPIKVGADHLKKHIRGWCGLFVTVSNSRIYLIHQTAKEFLLRRESNAYIPDGVWKHSLGAKEIDQLMTWICTNYLLISENDHRPSPSSPDQSENFYDYSARHWVDHAASSRSLTKKQQSDVMVNISDASRHLFQNWSTYHRGSFVSGNTSPVDPTKIAARYGLFELLQQLIKVRTPGNPYMCDDDLIEASFFGHSDIVIFLLNNGFIFDHEHRYALIAAARGNRENIVQTLIEYGANVNAGNGSVLSGAAFHGNEKIVRLLLDHGANVNAGNGRVLYSAARKGNEGTIQLLLDHGANVNAGNGEPLLYAAIGGHERLVRLLLDHGADVNADNGSALHEALLNGKKETVQMLLDHGADVNANSRAALSAATDRGYQDIVQILLNHSAGIK